MSKEPLPLPSKTECQAILEDAARTIADPKERELFEAAVPMIADFDCWIAGDVTCDSIMPPWKERRDGSVQMLRVITKAKGMVVLSGYNNNLYQEWLCGWKRIDREALADGAKKRTESLWLNPAVASQLNGDLFSLLEGTDK